MSVGLFIGVESYNWNLSDFESTIRFCERFSIKQVVLKIYEITQGEWYQSLGGPDIPIKMFKDANIDVLPYGFYYGQDISTEANTVLSYLTKYNKYCMDMESDFDGNADKVRNFSNFLQNHVGDLYVSTWANPGTQNWSDNITILDPIVQVWMPQAYSDSLVKDMYGQFPKVQGKIWPTFHIANTPYLDASIYPDCTLWEYDIAQIYPTELNQFLQVTRGEKVTTYPVNPNTKLVANFLPVSQFQPGKSEFECGAFAVALAQRSTNYNVNNLDNSYNLVKFAETEYAKYAGNNAPSNNAGASVADMHNMLKDAGLHWWDLPISPTSPQDSDIAMIKAAIQHGYTVIATVSEASVFDVVLNANPYWWGPSGNHIITYAGISDKGNLLAIDPANVVKGDGNLQTPKTVQKWGREYDITKLDNQWATIVQTPWLPSVLSGNPLQWPAYAPPTPSQPITQTNVVIMYDSNSNSLVFMNTTTNQAIYRINL